MKKTLPIFILIAVIFAAAGFFGGQKYQQSKRPQFNRQQFAGQLPSNNNQRRSDFRPISGEILSLDTKSLTIKLDDGSSKIILLTDKTNFTKSTTITLTDLKAGQKISAFGATNTDGSLSANLLQLL